MTVFNGIGEWSLLTAVDRVTYLKYVHISADGGFYFITELCNSVGDLSCKLPVNVIMFVDLFCDDKTVANKANFVLGYICLFLLKHV